MKELEYTFIGKGEVKDMVFTHIISCLHGYVYQVTSTAIDEDGKEIVIKPHYEIFKRRVNRRFESVRYPSSKDFGVWAWTATEMKRAFEIFFSKIYPAAKRDE